MNDNLKFWNSVEKTDLEFTKPVNQRGGYTAIDPYYQLKLATEKFGPYGKGFGLVESKMDYSIFDRTGVINHIAVFYYTVDGKIFTFPINNAIKADNGKYFDVDYAKKVETNTVSKALSKLGFNTDVYMGKFEDPNYIHEIGNEQAIEKAANKEEELAKQKTERLTETNKVIEQIKSATQLSMVEGLFKSHARRINNKEPELMIALSKAKDESKERLNA